MKRILSILIFLLFAIFAEAQVLCVKCYDQNAQVIIDTSNLIVNGSFENGACPAYPPLVTFCPNATTNPTCTITNWTCWGGGSLTYACMLDTNYTAVGEGHLAAYFGNTFCYGCSNNLNDTSCISNIGCEATGIPAGYPYNTYPYGADTGLCLSQTVSGLTIGGIYLLEFWAGGEWDFTNDGLFAVDAGFGNIFLRDPVTPVGGIGRRFVIVFAAVSSSHTIKFTSWGHIGNPNCTELILDDVRLLRKSGEIDLCLTAIHSPGQNAEIIFSPNPASSNSEITFTYPSLSTFSEIIINNIDGKEVVRYTLPPWSTTQKIKLAEMARGVYVARMVNEKANANVKFVVE